MIQMNFNPLLIMEIKRRQDEMAKEFEMLRLAREATQSQLPKVSTSSKLLSKIGKELVSFGSSLEHKFGLQEEMDAKLNQQESPEGCS